MLEQRLALGLRQRLGVAFGQEDLRVIFSALRFHSRKVCASFFEKRAMLARFLRSRPSTSAEPSRCAWPNS